MKKVLLIFISTLMLFVYTVSDMGFGLHRCLGSGNISLVFLTQKTTCQEIHPNCTCGCCHSSIDEDCDHCTGAKISSRCITDVYSLDGDQIVVDNNFDFSSDYLITIVLEDLLLIKDAHLSILQSNNYEELPYWDSNQLRSFISLWRI